jgi:hypothetical protein
MKRTALGLKIKFRAKQDFSIAFLPLFQKAGLLAEA